MAQARQQVGRRWVQARKARDRCPCERCEGRLDAWREVVVLLAEAEAAAIDGRAI